VTARLDAAAVAADLPDGATVALGGAGLQRKPMALVRALAAAGRRDLTVISFLGSLDVELLLASGCVRELHSAGVSLDGAGLAPRFRHARQQGAVRFVEWSEGTLLCALDAAARGLPSLPTWSGLGSDLPRLNEGMREGSDPFTGDPVMNVRALEPDLALLHAPAVDEHGNAYVPGDMAADGLLARAARRTVVSHEIVREPDPARVAIGRIWIDVLVEAPHGALPTGCHPVYGADLEAVSRWSREGAGADAALSAPEGVV
jgi:glutaconate CoA-transferase, subunit A